MKFDDALLYVAKYLSTRNDEVSPQFIFYRCRGKIALVQIHTSLRILVEHKLVDVRYGENRFYSLNKKGRQRLNAITKGEIIRILDKPTKRKK